METPSEITGPSGGERRLLTIPNLISLARLATVPVFLYLFATGREGAAVALYAVGAASDFLDGYVARRTHAVTDLGKLLDPLADRVFIAALCVALLARGVLSPWLAGTVIVRDLALLSLWPLLERRGMARIPVNLVGKVATALLLVGLTALAVSETDVGWATIGRDIGGVSVFMGAVFYWAAAALYAREARERLRRTRVEKPIR
jgi:cardiolipin synthase